MVERARMAQRGFTLIELVVVLVIIGIIASIGTAMFSGAGQDAAHLDVHHGDAVHLARRAAEGDHAVVLHQHHLGVGAPLILVAVKGVADGLR